MVQRPNNTLNMPAATAPAAPADPMQQANQQADEEAKAYVLDFDNTIVGNVLFLTTKYLLVIECCKAMEAETRPWPPTPAA